MRHLFEDILLLDDIKGVVLFSEDGLVLFKEFLVSTSREIENEGWLSEFITLSHLREIELIYENDRIYLRRLTNSVLLIWMGGFAPMAMLRVNCEVLIPSLEKILNTSKWRRLFKGS